MFLFNSGILNFIDDDDDGGLDWSEEKTIGFSGIIKKFQKTDWESKNHSEKSPASIHLQTSPASHAINTDSVTRHRLCDWCHFVISRTRAKFFLSLQRTFNWIDKNIKWCLWRRYQVALFHRKLSHVAGYNEINNKFRIKITAAWVCQTRRWNAVATFLVYTGWSKKVSHYRIIKKSY